jgi:hypothetical protein
MNYKNFIESKRTIRSYLGFECGGLPKNLFPFQDDIVRKAIKQGRYAIFADCGLGKTLMQLEWANQVSKKTQKPVLILCPLAVSGQTIKEGVKFGIDVCRLGSGKVSDNNIYITNYEQIENIDNVTGHNILSFSGVVLDESSILKNFTGKNKNLIIDSFAQTQDASRTSKGSPAKARQPNPVQVRTTAKQIESASALRLAN